jgi:hypothetical protein
VYLPSDQEHDTKSSKRKLDKTLVLLVQQKFDKVEDWVLPQGLHKQRETIRQVIFSLIFLPFGL